MTGRMGFRNRAGSREREREKEGETERGREREIERVSQIVREMRETWRQRQGQYKEKDPFYSS